MKKNVSRRKGFTLIELLVVITIIGILASLAVPAIGSAIAKANQVKDVNNIRQLGIIFFTDANENLNGKFRKVDKDGTAATKAADVYAALFANGLLNDPNVLAGNNVTPFVPTGELKDVVASDLDGENLAFSVVGGLSTTSNGSLPLLVTKGALDNTLTGGADLTQEVTIEDANSPWEDKGVAVYRVAGNAAFVPAVDLKIKPGAIGTGKLPAAAEILKADN